MIVLLIRNLFFVAPGIRKELNKQREKAFKIITASLVYHPKLQNNSTVQQLLAYF